MQVNTILNRVQKHRCFLYGAVRFVEGAAVPIIEAEIRRGGGLEQPSKTDHKKSVRFWNVSCDGDRFVPYTWCST